MKTATTTVALTLILLGVGSSAAQGQESGKGGAVIVAVPETIEWAPAPASLPEGAELAVLEGDPTQPGEFTMRLRMPANYTIPPHFHRAPEHVTVIQGTFHVGMGDTIDRSAGSGLPEGTLGVIPPGMRHFAWTEDDDVIIQLHGNGPWGIYYVNVEDDPRRGR